MSKKFPRDIPVPRFDPYVLLWGLAVILAIIFVRTSIYTIEPQSEGVVLRFGQYLKIATPGLRFKVPFGVDRVSIVPVKRQLKQEFGFKTSGATNPYQYSDDPDLEKAMVTGDLNAASVEWIVQYRISNPRDYLFNVRNPDDTLRDASESVMREVVGDRTVDEVITVGRREIEAEALTKLQILVDKFAMGMSIDQVQLKNVDPPREVQSSFNEVNQAQQEREQLINEANAEYNREVPKAKGTADQTISAAQGYATQRINEAEGNADRFNAIFLEYTKAPEVTRRRIYLETMGEVIPNLGKKIIIDGDTNSVLPLLQLSDDKSAQ